MKGFHSGGLDIRAHETVMTIGKKIANSIDGKTICLVVVALAVAVEPATAACGGVKHANPARDGAPGGVPAPLAIGDSVMLGAIEELAGAGFEVNARGCRQMSHGVRLIERRLRARRLPGAVLILLGANWTIERRQIERALRLLGPERHLVLLTPFESGGWGGRDARRVRAAGRRHPRRVMVLDWVDYGAGHPRWFGDDGLHLTSRGAAALARLCSRVLPKLRELGRA
jgi:hypothetical protein